MKQEKVVSLRDEASSFSCLLDAQFAALQINLGSGTEAEQRFAANFFVFAWMLKENRIWIMRKIRQEWTPLQVYHYMVENDENYRSYLEAGNINENEISKLDAANGI